MDVAAGPHHQKRFHMVSAVSCQLPFKECGSCILMGKRARKKEISDFSTFSNRRLAMPHKARTFPSTGGRFSVWAVETQTTTTNTHTNLNTLIKEIPSLYCWAKIYYQRWVRQSKYPSSSLPSRGNKNVYTKAQNTRQTVTSTAIDTQINCCHSTYTLSYNYQFICVSLPLLLKPSRA